MNNSAISVVNQIIENQKKIGRKIITPKPGDKIGFAFSTKDRTSFTKSTLDSIDQEKGFDIVWVDGSVTEGGKNLPKNYEFKNVHLAEYHSNVSGGPDVAIQYGLKRLLDLGYDYCGLIENDIIFQPDWFKNLVELFSLSASDGIVAGAVTIRNFETRVIEYKKDYTINWNIGAGMILFTREAAQLVVDNYKNLATTGLGMRHSYGKLLGIDLKNNKELFKGRVDYFLSLDYSFDRILCKNGFSSIGSIPSLVSDLEFDMADYGLKYVEKNKSNIGLIYPKVPKASLLWLSMAEPILFFLCSVWKKVKKVKWIYIMVKSIERKIFKKPQRKFS